MGACLRRSGALAEVEAVGGSGFGGSGPGLGESIGGREG